MQTWKSKVISAGLNLLYYVTLGILIIALIFPYTSYFYYKPLFIPFNQRLNHHDIILEKGEAFRLYPLSLQKKVRYSSSDFKVAEVNNTGRVYGKNCGQAVIKVQTEQVTMKCRVRVISLNHRSVTIKKGKTLKLKVAGAGAWCRWKSSNKTIVSVGRTGKMKAKKAGNAYVTVVIKGKTLKCKVIVKD